MLTTIEKVLLLQDLEIFRFASTEHLARLAALCKEKVAAPEETLFNQAENSSRLFLLVEGRVELRGPDSSVTTVEKCGLDFWSFFAESGQQATAKTLEECRLLVVNFPDMVDLLTAEPEFCWAILKHLARLGRKQEGQQSS